MHKERFGLFSHKISFIDKCIKALEAEAAAKFGIKGVHMFWIYSLSQCPEGLSASEIAKANNVNRSLISREIKKLVGESIVTFSGGAPTENRYNQRILLTEKGRAIAEEIRRVGLSAQQETNRGIPPEEIAVFYSVLERMSANLGAVVNKK